MAGKWIEFQEKTADLLQRLFALKITDTERARSADPQNIYLDDISNRRPRIVAAILAILFHFMLFIVVFPDLGRELILQENVLRLRNLAKPAGGGPPKAKPTPPKPKKAAPKPKPKLVPIPDPTPNDPEPIERNETIPVPQILNEVAFDLNVDDIAAPSGAGLGTTGRGTGPASGDGSSDGAGDGIYTVGGGVSNPQLIRQTLPSYTDEAIRAKVQGTVLLSVVVRKDGSVDNFKILKALGYGLDERAIHEIANNWVFRPGTLNGRPVDVRATIEVSFTLR